MDIFSKWFTASFILGLLGFFSLFFIEDIGRITGEFNQNLLLYSILTVFIISCTSLYCLFKANAKRIKSELAISILISIVPMLTLALNGLIFTVYFIGK